MTAHRTKLLPISEMVWQDKYKFTAPDKSVPRMASDSCIEDTWQRIAKALAAPEGPDARLWEKRFYGALENFAFIPAGRILAGGGTGRDVTLFNCMVSGTIPDSMEGIFQKLKEAALTLQQGAGIGMDFSTLRPRGAEVKGVAAKASGPVSFMDCWDAMCKTIMSAGYRRGAMMGTMRCDHPDIEEFIDAKRDPLRLRMFNVSVLVTDAFMEAIAISKKESWTLQFDGKYYRSVRARELWDKIMRSAYEYAEPGVIFIDRINKSNNLAYCETISATNPCAEQPLPPNGACLLGSINLTAFIREPFSDGVYFDAEGVMNTTRLAVRMLDNVIDVSNYPLLMQRDEARNKRRIGLGITGLADALIMVGLHYGSPEACRTAALWMKIINETAYETSIKLAVEKGEFPAFRPQMGKNYYDRSDQPTRNSHLTSIAPTGTISLLAGNISSGIEPVFEWQFKRNILMPDDSREAVMVEDYATRLYRDMFPQNELPPQFYARAHELSPGQHLAMQAALQPYVDSSISKTVNCPQDMTFEAFEKLYLDAYESGLKVCAAFRPNETTGSILTPVDEEGIDCSDIPEAKEEWFRRAKLVKPDPSTPGLEQDPPGFQPSAVARDRAKELKDELKELAAMPDPAFTFVTNEPELPIPEDVRLSFNVPDEGQRRDLLDLIHKASEVSPQSEPLGTFRTAPPLNAWELPLPRPENLIGQTYKIRWGSHAIYITINNWPNEGNWPSPLNPVRPYEIFINSKNPDHHAWMIALTRMISAIWRRGGDTFFVVEELKCIVDPMGGQWTNGKYVPSLQAAIGEVIDRHITPVNPVPTADEIRESIAADLNVQKGLDEYKRHHGSGPVNLVPDGLGEVQEQWAEARAKGDARRAGSPESMAATLFHFCPTCGSTNVWFPKPNCLTCRDCSYSNCE